ncbi:uncharacterized protein Z518_03980 [Rhinocladiella mackenziei CBS 650.93]|uniref:Arginine N-methyltransferase 2 n=1 Tax=Rhinocladiella mackenziei CBS 650.93 TaxID=1442369 RepID=A0A0D2ISD3_9EURO|nr:uncharacterized protein Z518_03980 [Rhinocladiella mackenziei CBS 650.93]KIX06006.1 hypothetical protein Z518_03980 [Rhinocladiella mackenziei CBS 650.93]
MSTGSDDEVVRAQIQEIIQASSKHDIQALERCINAHSFMECKAVDVQDPTTGFTPLHAAIASCQTLPNGDGHEPSNQEEEQGANTLRFLLENGAIWNQLDNNDETPGCLAHRLGLSHLYHIMVDAGVRAEMLLSRLEEYEELNDNEDAEEDSVEDAQPAGTELEQTPDAETTDLQQEVNSSVYLSSTLSLGKDKLLDERHNGVMMAWESDIMSQSADAILFQPNLQILNIGFGMGIVDSHIQNHTNKPANHHILEAHPDILAEMSHKGWMDKSNVIVHNGKWQDVLPRLVSEGVVFDAIYFDTFAESYSQFREFFSEQVIGLLNPDGRWSFFNGMGADRQISYDVYQKVLELDLFESGFDVEWKDVDLPKLDGEWEGVRRKYWNVDRYRLPICKFMD